MKTVVSLQDLLELEIRPEALLGEYQERLTRDLAVRWAAPLREVACPGCGGTDGAPAFERHSVSYRECRRCASFFASPRPAEAVIVDFYREATAARFWREQMWPRTEAVRREKIVGPRVEWVLDGLAEYAPGASTGLDISPYSAALVEQLCFDGGRRMVAGSWTADLDVPSPPAGVRVEPLTLQSLTQVGPFDFVTAFDAVDRAPDLPALVEGLARVLRPGGLLFLTAPNADGFDLQVLWERAPALTPPDKLNVLSIDGLRRRFALPDWDLLEISTPGMFDVEIVRRAIEAEPDLDWPRFVRKLVTSGHPHALRDFQEYLQRHRLASFTRVLARRR